MGVGGISIWQLLIVLAIVIMIFGTKKLKSLGSDLGSAVKGFRQTVTDKTEENAADEVAQPTSDSTVQQNQSSEEHTNQQTETKEKV